MLMKCPNCGAETQEKNCEYCGSEIIRPQQSNTEINNQQMNVDTSDTEIVSVGTCPKCSSSKISFKRERTSTSTNTTSKKNYVGSGRKSHSVSQSSYRTIGVCQNCGFTWNPNQSVSPQSKGAPTWLWVIGWICIFPIPLTILLLRKKNMNAAIKYGIIAMAWIVYLLIGLFGGSQNKEDNTIETTGSDSNVAIENESTDVSKYIDSIVDNYNSKAEEQLVFVEEFTPSDKDNEHYRVEFRLEAWKDAIGKSYKVNDTTVDIVAVNPNFGDINFRVYSFCDLKIVSQLVDGFSPLLDEDLKDSELNDALNKIENDKEVNGYDFGKLGILLMKKSDDKYELMLKKE